MARPLFQAIIRPHLSLSARGFWIIFTLLGAFILVQIVIFSALGAWPVASFLGLDFLLFVLALLWSYRRAERWEAFYLTSDQLTVTRGLGKGREQKWTFDPYWIKLEVEEDQVFKSVQLNLRLRQFELEIARDLSRAEKLGFASALRIALDKARGREADA